jgi:hypothetical protein
MKKKQSGPTKSNQVPISMSSGEGELRRWPRRAVGGGGRQEPWGAAALVVGCAAVAARGEPVAPLAMAGMRAELRGRALAPWSSSSSVVDSCSGNREILWYWPRRSRRTEQTNGERGGRCGRSRGQLCGGTARPPCGRTGRSRGTSRRRGRPTLRPSGALGGGGWGVGRRRLGRWAAAAREELGKKERKEKK